MKARLSMAPLAFGTADRVAAKLHRHHFPVHGHRFGIGVVTAVGVLVGAPIAGRPVARRQRSCRARLMRI